MLRILRLEAKHTDLVHHPSPLPNSSTYLPQTPTKPPTMQYPILAILLLARYSAAGILKKGTCNGFFLASPEVEQANDWDVIRRSQGGCPQYQYANAEQANPPSAAAEGVLYTCNCMNRDITADHQGTSQCCASSNGHLNAREVRLPNYPPSFSVHKVL